jgi:DNA-binding transcriptional LysR family regulator
MVERKLGFGFLPQIALTQELRQGRLVSFEIVDAEPLSRNLDVIHPRHRPLAKEAQDFLRLLREAVTTTATASRPAKHRVALRK